LATHWPRGTRAEGATFSGYPQTIDTQNCLETIPVG
jgi:hypothetical protein